MRRIFAKAALGVALALSALGAAQAEPYPSRPITMVVPISAGGGHRHPRAPRGAGDGDRPAAAGGGGQSARRERRRGRGKRDAVAAGRLQAAVRHLVRAGHCAGAPRRRLGPPHQCLRSGEPGGDHCPDPCRAGHFQDPDAQGLRGRKQEGAAHLWHFRHRLHAPPAGRAVREDERRGHGPRSL